MGRGGLVIGLAVTAVLAGAALAGPAAAYAAGPGSSPGAVEPAAPGTVQVSGETDDATLVPMTLTVISAPGGQFTAPPHPSVGPQFADFWSATVPAGGTVTLTYAFDGSDSVTFTNNAAGGGTCAITPADPDYTCRVAGTVAHREDILAQPPVQVSGDTGNGTGGLMTLTGSSAFGGRFTQPPHPSVGPGISIDHWEAIVPPGGTVILTYAFGGSDSVTFTNNAAGGGTCVITPASANLDYDCDVRNVVGWADLLLARA